MQVFLNFLFEFQSDECWHFEENNRSSPSRTKCGSQEMIVHWINFPEDDDTKFYEKACLQKIFT